MKNMELNLGINTTDTFTTADGTVVAYQDIFEGILSNINFQARHNGWRMSREDLQDMAQDAFLKAIMRHASFNASKCRKAQDWGNRIAENQKYDTRREVAIHASRFTTLEVQGEDGEERIPVKVLGYNGEEYAADYAFVKEERDIERARRIGQLLSAMEELDEQYREVLWLTVSEGLKPKEIAEILDCTPNAVSVRLSKAKAAIRGRLDIPAA